MVWVDTDTALHSISGGTVEMDAPGAWLNRDLDNIDWPFSNFS